MNSLNDLNGQLVTVEYSDYRPPGVEFDTTTPANQTVTLLEGQSHSVPVGINIVDIVDYAVSAVSYTIDVSSQPGAVVTWSPIPTGCVVTNPSPGIYTISGINDAYTWSLIKSPMITPDPDFYGVWTYTATINYLSSLSKSWTVTATVSNVVELSAASPMWFITGSNPVTGVPLMLDSANPIASWQITVTPSNAALVSTLTTAGSGGTASFNNTSKILTINGTNAQINSHLNTLTYVTNGAIDQDFTFTYVAQRITTLETDTQIQNMRSALVRFLSTPQTQSFNEDQVFLVANPCLITDIDYTGAGTYTVTVQASGTTLVRTISTAGSGGTASWNNSTKRLTITGTKTQVNSHLSTMTVTAGVDSINSFTLTYNIVPVVAGSPGTLTKVQTLAINETHNEAINFNLPRDFVNGQNNLIFATNTPQITDLDTLATSYTIGLTVASTAIGTFSAPGTTTSNVWTYTGTKAQVNALFNQIAFTPAAGVFANTTMTYTQSKQSSGTVSQITQSVALNGPDIVFDVSLPPANQTATQDEAGFHTVPSAINIVGVNDPATTLPTYTINVSGLAGTTVTWTTIPPGSVVSNPSPGVYTINNVTAANWATVKNPRVTPPVTYNGTFAYTATINWNSNGAQSTSWTVTAAVQDDVTFNPTTPVAQAISTFEGTTHTALYGTDITRVYNTANETAPSYTIDLTNAPGSTVTWATVPAGCTVDQPTANSYRISGIDTVAKWQSVRAPTIQLNNFTSGSITYTSTITYSGGQTKSWITAATITNEDALTSVSPFVYYSGTTQTLTGVPQIVDTGVQTPIWTVTVTPSSTSSVVLLSSAGSGGSSTFNATTKVLTITGTKTQVNSHLSTISLSSATGWDLTYTLTYYASNNLNIETSTKVQSLSSNNYTVLSAVTSNLTYTTGQSVYITGNPVITDSSNNGLGTYTLTIQPNPTAALTSITSQYPAAISAAEITDIDAYNDIAVYGFGDYNQVISYRTTGSGLQQIGIVGTPSTPSPLKFGYSVAVWGEWMAISAPETNGTLGLEGRVYMYKLVSGVWTYQETLSTPTLNAGAELGRGLAMSNNRLLVGAPGYLHPGEFVRPGRVFAYELSGSSWSMTQELSGSVESYNEFGDLVKMDNNTAIVTSQYNGTRVYVYGGSGWTVQQTLPSIWPVGEVGTYMSIHGDTITLIGNQSVQVYFRTGTAWSLQQSITNPGATDNRFGYTQSVYGDYLLIGAYQSDINGNEAGAVYVYRRDNGSWSLTQTLVHPSPGILERFGLEVFLNQNLYHIGSRLGLRVGLVYDISSYNSTTKTLTLTGTRTEVNDSINSYQIVTAPGYINDFELIYTATTPLVAQSRRNQTVNKV